MRELIRASIWGINPLADGGEDYKSPVNEASSLVICYNPLALKKKGWLLHHRIVGTYRKEN